MGLTSESIGLNVLRNDFNIEFDREKPIIALAGNPNTGKSTVFNGLTGLRQHTGNWPGKTVTQARGLFKYKDQDFMIVDLPGTYSLLANSTEEKIARDFICFARPDATIVVTDATNLERNLNLVLQVLELTNKVIVCVNLMDEARRKNIKIDIEQLKDKLKIPVVPTVARDGKGLKQLKETVYQMYNNLIEFSPIKITYSKQIEDAVDQIIPILKNNMSGLTGKLNLRWLALRLIEGDQTILESINKYQLNFEADLNQYKEGEVQTDGIS
ncbi:MAG: FeoB small GTPase domain-containing protein [Halothermotrichaceae bacterium]